MGTYLNPGNGMFQEALDSRTHVDKSGMLALSNAVVKTSDKYICVSRPRRFGKSMALDMMAAYYCRTCDSRAQFEGLAIASDPSFAEHLNRYDVVRLVMNDFSQATDGVEELIARIETRVMREVRDAYPDAVFFDDDTLADTLQQAYQHTGVPFVILIDEWDCVMREREGDQSAQRAYAPLEAPIGPVGPERAFRSWLVALLKDKEYVGLAYIEGERLAQSTFSPISSMCDVSFFRDYRWDEEGNLAAA